MCKLNFFPFWDICKKKKKCHVILWFPVLLQYHDFESPFENCVLKLHAKWMISCGLQVSWDISPPTFSDRRVKSRWSLPSFTNSGKRTAYLWDKWEYLVPTSNFLRRALASSIKLILKWKQSKHFSKQSYDRVVVLSVFVLFVYLGVHHFWVTV
jgi:hypothetical protein